MEELARCLPEILEHHVLPHLQPADLAALLAANRTLYAWPLRQRLWAHYKRHCCDQRCWGCGRSPLTAAALFVRFDASEYPCALTERDKKSGSCWFSHLPNETWAFCSEACFMEHTVRDTRPSDGGLYFDCDARMVHAWRWDGYVYCDTPFALPAWPRRVRTAADPALTLEGMLPEILKNYVLPHLAPEDVMNLLMTTRRRWAWRDAVRRPLPNA
jgi:hypothetical protein